MQKYIIKILLEIPIFGPFLIILNAWVLENTSDFSIKIASPLTYIKKLFLPLTFSILSTYILYFNYANLNNVNTTIFIDLNIQIFSSLLGFGLAIFLIVFTISSESIMKIMGSIDNAKLLCVQFSYPMIVWSMNLLFSTIFKFISISSDYIISYRIGLFSFFMLIYSFVVLFSTISSVFFTGMLKISIEEKPKNP